MLMSIAIMTAIMTVFTAPGLIAKSLARRRTGTPETGAEG